MVHAKLQHKVVLTAAQLAAREAAGTIQENTEYHIIGDPICLHKVAVTFNDGNALLLQFYKSSRTPVTSYSGIYALGDTLNIGSKFIDNNSNIGIAMITSIVSSGLTVAVINVGASAISSATTYTYADTDISTIVDDVAEV